MLWAVSPAVEFLGAWRSVAESSSSEVRWADSVAVVAEAASLMRRTKGRRVLQWCNSPRSAIAPVMSSGNSGAHGEVAVREVAHLVHQPQNGLLGAVALGFSRFAQLVRTP